MNDVTVIIPSLNPDEKLIGVVDSLIGEGFGDIVLVDDGSDEEHRVYFDRLEGRRECTILHHEVNRGKGRGLKTAFEYCIGNRQGLKGVVTVDGDGQHKAADIMNCVRVMLDRGDRVILGSRDFSGADVPFKSRFGNRLTSFTFKFVCGLTIGDTQTGLRAIPFQYLGDFCHVAGERFEYETNMLLELKQKGIGYEEVPISTVYIEDNASTHFNPFRDSIKIYGVILKFAAGSLGSSVIDLGAFAVISFITRRCMELGLAVLVATVLARVVSSLFNYTFNRSAVFGSKGRVTHTIARYYILCVCQMLVSYLLVLMVTRVLALGSVLTVVAKAVVDTLLFILSFQIQRCWVFK